MICFGCGTLDVRDARSTCARCGRPRVPVTAANLQRLLEEHVARASWSVVQTWVAYGQIDPNTAAWLYERYRPRGAVEGVPAPEPTAPPTAIAPEGAPAEPVAEQVAGGESVAPIASPAPIAATPAIAAARTPPPPAQPSTWSREVQPLLNENVGWFVGALLVLAGSIYGVREAWRSFGGVARHLVVGLALAAYAAGFVGLSRLVERRSRATARVLGSIGIALLPVAEVALASLATTDRAVALVASLGFGAIAAWLARSLARRFSLARPWALAIALVPSLLAEMPALGGFGVASVVAPFVGVVACAWAARAAPVATEAEDDAPPRGSFAVLGVAAYGAIALAIVARTAVGALPVATVASASIAWVVAMAAVVAQAARAPSARERFGAAAVATETVSLLALAFVPASAEALRISAQMHGAPTIVLALAGVVAIAALAHASRVRVRAMHAIGVASPFVAHLATLAVFEAAAWTPTHAWRVGACAIGPIALLVASRFLDERRAAIARGWGVLVAFPLLAAVPLVEALVDASARLVATSVVAGAVALAAHASGLRARRAAHLFGGLAALACAMAAIVPTSSTPDVHAIEILLAAALAYGALGALVDRLANEPSPRFSPLDDVSRLSALAAVGLALACMHVAPRFFLDAGRLALATPIDTRTTLAIVAALVVVARALRDGSRVLGALGALALAAPIEAMLGARAGAQPLFVRGLVALLLLAIATSRPRGVAPQRPVRRLLSEIPLGLPSSPRFVLADSFGLAGLLVALASAAPLLAWVVGLKGDPTRVFAVLAALLLAVFAAAAFATRALSLVRARGSVVALAAVLASLVGALVVDRLGIRRTPLEDAVAFSTIAVGLAGLAVVVRRLGPALAARLESAAAGARYADPFAVASTAMSAAIVLEAIAIEPGVARALLVAPPAAFLGAALALSLVAFAVRGRAVGHVAFALASAGAAIAAAQRALLGVALVRAPSGAWIPASRAATSSADLASLLDPRDRWSDLFGRALVGISLVVLAAAVIALLLAGARVVERVRPRVEAARAAFADRALAGGLVVVALLAFRADPIASIVVAATAGVLVLARESASASLLVPFAASGVVHALAQSTSIAIPSWTAPALAIVSLALVAFAARTPDRASFARPRALALVPLALAFAYALAASSPIDPLAAARSLADGAASAADGAPPRVLSHLAPLAWAAAPAALASLLAARTWSLARARGLAAFEAGASGLLVIATTVTGVAALLLAHAPSMARLPALPFEPEEPFVVAIFARGLAAAVALGLALGAASVDAIATIPDEAWARGRSRDPGEPTEAGQLARGLAASRDVALVVLLGVTALALSLPTSDGFTPPPHAFAVFLVALVLALAVCARVAIGRTSPLHVYLAELLGVVTYLIVHAERGRHLSREADATILLVLGFALVGVESRAKGTRAAVVASPLRTLVALLPLAIAGTLARGGAHASYVEAAFAAGVAALYATLGWTERSRFLFSLGVVSANVALFLALLASGLDGFEFQAAPAGLAILLVGHLWSGRFEPGVRVGVRVAGGLLLYGPAAIRLALRLGAGASGAYAIAFGAICLVGVAAGMLLHIRAYLALGATFLALDVVANLLAAGLRDHRVGFLLLSLSGLAILGVMVVVTTRREAVQRALGSVRGRMRGWE